MKSIAIMQPYFLAYWPYFQLINAVDEFIILDNVNYINKGYINRNALLLNHNKHVFTLPLVKASQNKLINQLELSNPELFFKKFNALIKHAYSKTDYYKALQHTVDNILMSTDTRCIEFLIHCLQSINDYLSIKTPMRLASTLLSEQYKGQDRIIQICKAAHATDYINPIGGKILYDSDYFAKHGINLHFLQSISKPYQQLNEKFVADLSVIDTIAFNNKETLQAKLHDYCLTPY